MIWIKIKRFFYRILGETPATMEMVKYWKTGDSVQAKIMNIDGVNYMQMEGEKYLFPGFPRGYLLFGKLSKLKHEIKNQIFNWTWEQLENARQEWAIVEELTQIIFPRIFEMLKDHRYDIVPPEAMIPSVKEIHRAWTKAVPGEKSYLLRDTLCYILTEDDSYRWRVMDMLEYFNPNTPFKRLKRFILRQSYEESIIKDFDFAMSILEHCEMIDDMKERERLWRRVMVMFAKDKRIIKKFVAICKELNWKKVFMTKADRYFMRGKYYRTDYRLFEY
jgi:hypothetical protein